MSSMHKNYNQIYTHCSKLGICIGQRWTTPEGHWGTVSCITEKGYVILDHSPKLDAPSRIKIDKLKSIGQLKEGVILAPYRRTFNRSVGIQVFVCDDYYDKTLYRVYGELRRDFENI